MPASRRRKPHMCRRCASTATQASPLQNATTGARRYGGRTISRQSGQACVSHILGRRRLAIWVEVAPCVGVRRAKRFLLPAGPGVGRGFCSFAGEDVVVEATAPFEGLKV